MTRSVAIIGAGQIGIAASHAFADKGWQVRVLSRSPSQFLHQDASFEPYVAGESPAPIADVVLDTIAFDEADVGRYSPPDIGRLIVVSSASVYCDALGRTLDEASQNGFPEFDGAISESQSTVAPGPATYSTRKVRMEHAALEAFGERATVLRPCAIHGPGSRHPREWWFVKRFLDGRDRIPLIHEGTSQFQTSSARMIGRFAAAAAEAGLFGIYNLADSDSPNVREIGNFLAKWTKARFELVLDIPADAPPTIGRTPWSVPKPFVVDGRKADKAAPGTRTSYRDSAANLATDLANFPPADWRSAFPQLAAYPWDLFDYEAEDRFLASL